MSTAKENLPARAADSGPLAVHPADTGRLMEIAIQQGEAGVAALERLVAMRERAEDRAAARAYGEAVGRFQESCPTVPKEAKGAHGAAYAPFDRIMRHIRPHLANAGLSVTFDSEEMDDGRLRVWCIVHHGAGHSERASATVAKEAKSNRMNDTQRDGSAMSYGKRYALGLALGISTGEQDDDGDMAGKQDPITTEQALNIGALMDEVKADGAGFLRYFRIEALDELPASRYAEAVAMLERKREKGGKK